MIKQFLVFTKARSVAHLIQLVDEIVERSSHTARLTELNTSDDEMAVKAITQSSFYGAEHE